MDIDSRWRIIRGAHPIEELVRDVRFALRSLRRAPAFTAVVILTLALGIGANSAVFSIVDAVLLHPLAVDHPATLVSIRESISDQAPNAPLSYPMFGALARRARSFDGIAAFATQDAVIATAAESQQLATSAVSGNYFAVLGVRPQIGRLLTPGDDDVPGAHPVVVLSDALWSRAYNRSRAIVGSTIKIGNNPFTIVGVAPRGFRGTSLSEAPQIWVPATMLADIGLGGFLAASNRPRLFGLRYFHYWHVVGRLRDDRASGVATAELNTIYAQEKASEPKKSLTSLGIAGREVKDPVSLVPINTAAAWGDRADLVRFVTILAAVVVLTLLIACFNVANLFLVRSGQRSLELSVRSSLGASRRRIAQQLIVEGLLLGLAGGVGGLMVGRAAVSALRSFTLPGHIELVDIPFALNGRVLAATMLLGALTTLIFGVGPAIRSSRANLISTLRQTQASAESGARALLLGCQVALSIVLLVGAGLFVRTMQAGLHSDIGFDPAPLAAARVNPALGGHKDAEVATFYQITVDRASHIPGVTGVALSSHVPLADFGPLPFVSADKAATAQAGIDDQVNAGWTYISPNYFDVLRIPIVEGRAFIPDDTVRALSTAIINQAAAKALFPNGHAVGATMVHAGMMRFTIVGVVRDTKYATVNDVHVPMIYTPMTPDFNDDVHIIVRSAMPATALAELRRILSTVPPRPPVRDARLVADQVNAVLEPQRFGATLLGTYSLLALIIAAIGVYGIVAYMIARQRREIGIRIALGARPIQVIELIVSRIAVVVALGMIGGLAAALLVSRALERFLYGVSPTDFVTFAGAALAMFLAATAACLLPTRRALTIDAASAMRVE